MIINYVPEHFELEEEGLANQVLVAVRYTGDKSSTTSGQINRSAAWPGFSAFQGASPDSDANHGPAQGGLVPDWTADNVEDRTIEALESNPDFEVLYSPKDIAEAMLESNYLDPNVFGQGFDPDLRERVFDELGLEDVGVRQEAEYREQLREIADVDADEAEVREETRDDSRVTEYRQEHTRDELRGAARILEKDDDDVGKIELAEWLADHDREAVRFAFEGKSEAARDVAGLSDGPSEPEPEPLTADDAVEMYEYDELKAVVKAVREGTGEFSLRGNDINDMASFLVEDKGLTEAEIDAHLTE